MTASDHFLELVRDGSAAPIEADGSFWADLMSGRRVIDGWLISILSLESEFSHWERHMDGEEIVILRDGAVEIDLEEADGVRTVALTPDSPYAIVPRRTWHFGRARVPSTLVFITPAGSTEHRAP